MRHFALGVLVAALGCGSSPQAAGSKTDPGDVTGGSRGGGEGGSGGGGAGGIGGSGGSATPDASAAGTGGAAGEGGAGDPDAAADSNGPVEADAGTSGSLLGFYEAEAVGPAGPNELIAPAVVSNCPNMSP